MAGQLGTPAGPGTEDWRAGKITEAGAAVCGSVSAGAGTEPPRGGAVRKRRAPWIGQPQVQRGLPGPGSGARVPQAR
ncbi:hypothetical protein NDU88_003510 [Pleurodeles waltl]|uniref:Uncharacterized protein n=1 Tax=Pleurodeles waltl TaxID=8319 RepID=A0AAV7SEN2_PLEWA|nr:hypothetical protein NDU88_003510 [Pleurodeles waltl]